MEKTFYVRPFDSDVLYEEIRKLSKGTGEIILLDVN